MKHWQITDAAREIAADLYRGPVSADRIAAIIERHVVPVINGLSADCDRLRAELDAKNGVVR